MRIGIGLASPTLWMLGGSPKAMQTPTDLVLCFGNGVEYRATRTLLSS
jgi:hypothetical protein